MKLPALTGRKAFLLIFLLPSILLSACGGPALPLRSDMPTDFLQQAVTYTLSGPANSDQEENVALLRGLNDSSTIQQLETRFGRMSGSVTQDVTVTQASGQEFKVLGMVKPKRTAGFTASLSLEPAGYTAIDSKGNAVCGSKIRLDFKRNLVEQGDPDLRDFSSLWYYDVPCTNGPQGVVRNEQQATLRAIVLNQIWQFRLFWGSAFVNWGHSVTIIDPRTRVAPLWWRNWDLPGTNNDALGAANVVNGMVKDLEASRQPWLEFSPNGQFNDAYLIYSAGDADQYANFDRIFLNRQQSYAVFYRPTRQSAWQNIVVKPTYNLEWNDAGQLLAKSKGWGDHPFDGKLNERGLPSDDKDEVVSELEKIGWMNAPNAALEQIQYLDSRNNSILYTMTVRGYVGANDSLILFGPVKPQKDALYKQAPQGEQIPKPTFYDDKGAPLDSDHQYTDEQWAQWQRESTVWNYIKGDPTRLGFDLALQYRFSDNTEYTPIPCEGDEGGTCGYRPTRWNLQSSYYINQSQSRGLEKAWLISQLLGEVGVRTLGMSYNSGRYQGTGLLFAMSQILFREHYYAGFTQEDVFMFDARASQLPGVLEQSWRAVHGTL